MRLEINYQTKTVKNRNTWSPNNTLLNNQEITEEIKEEIKKYLETNHNKKIMTQNLWDAAKAVLRGKFRAIQAYFKKQEKSQIKQPNLTPKETRERRTKPKDSRRKEIIKTRGEMSEKEMKKNNSKDQ